MIPDQGEQAFVFEYNSKDNNLEVLSYAPLPMLSDDYVVSNFNNRLPDVYVTLNMDPMILDKYSMFSNTLRTSYDIPPLLDTVSTLFKMADNSDSHRYALAYLTACNSVISGLQDT